MVVTLIVVLAKWLLNIIGIILICQWSSSADPLSGLETIDHFMNHGLESKVSQKIARNDGTDVENKVALQIAKDPTGTLDWNIY